MIDRCRGRLATTGSMDLLYHHAVYGKVPEIEARSVGVLQQRPWSKRAR